jgi:glycine hydroxymethyltransferase
MCLLYAYHVGVPMQGVYKWLVQRNAKGALLVHMKNDTYPHIALQDDQVVQALRGEDTREAEGLELIPSENYVSRAVLEALGSSMTNKYAEGYPGKRYYGGQEYTDAVEALAIERAKELFGCKFANVQPLSGAPANIAVYFALLEPGDTVLGMDLSHGGHLTHGHPVTMMTKVFNFVRYKMKDVETGEIDYEDMLAVAKRERPKIILAGFSAYSRELDYAKFVAIGREVGALVMADIAHIAGLIAGKVAHNPFDVGFDVMTTTTHKTLRGPRGGMVLVRESAEIAKKIDKTIFPGLQGGPHMNNIAGKAVAFKEALTPAFKKYAQQILLNAKAMEEVFRARNVRMLCGGTSNHLILADVYGSLGVTGQEAERVLDEVGITVNKNMIADDPRSPMDPSGIRFGTPALTTRGFDEKGSARVAELMLDAMAHKDDREKKKEIRETVRTLALSHPVPEVF